nr:trans-4-hydroxy-L-proline dehydratase activase [uncultured Peptostreptococcus sp.]
MKPLIINIQKCSIHDGPGIRTTVFFKGCPLSCAWCHNPESQNFQVDFMYDPEKCTHCYTCVEKCEHDAICVKDGKLLRLEDECELCGTCLDWCLSGSRELVGDEYSVTELVKEIEKDSMFYEESGGGVTLSGGEVMCQNIEYLDKLIDRLHDKDIDIAIDTCGYAPKENFEKLYPKVDRFLYDIKLVDEDLHKKFTGKSNDLILDNLKYLDSVGANINIRIPLIEGVNVDEDNKEIERIIELLKPLRISAVSLLPYHNIMEHKYCKLDKKYRCSEFKKPSTEKLEEIKNLFLINNFNNVKIGG